MILFGSSAMPDSPLVIIGFTYSFTRRHVVLSTALHENKRLLVFCDGNLNQTSWNGLTKRTEPVLFGSIFHQERNQAMSIDVQEAIKRSIQTEKNAMNFYQLGAVQMKNQNARKTFEFLAREEREHAGQFYKIYKGSDIPSLDVFLDTPPDNES